MSYGVLCRRRRGMLGWTIGASRQEVGGGDVSMANPISV